MDFLLLFSVALLVQPISAQQEQNVEHFHEASGAPPSSWALFKRLTKRLQPIKISECMLVSAEENLYFYKADSDSDDVCGVYLYADPDEVIEVHFQYLNVNCESGGLVSFLDGWELSGKFFPEINDEEKPFDERYHEFCGTEKPKKIFTSSQNAGMIHYRIPSKGNGFSFYVRFRKNPTPCDVLVENKEGVYTLRNYGKARNCTLLTVFPAKVQLYALNVGVSSPAVETGTIYECQNKHLKDGLLIGGSENLDSSQLVVFEDLCGLDSSPGIGELVIGCGVTVVRLVSSGRHDNSATFSISQPEELKLLESSLTCEL